MKAKYGIPIKRRVTMDIDRCLDCPARSKIQGGLECSSTTVYHGTKFRKIINPNKIPKWCPLPEVKPIPSGSCHACDSFKRRDKRYSWGTCSNEEAHQIFGFKGKDEYHKNGACSCHSSFQGE